MWHEWSSNTFHIIGTYITGWFLKSWRGNFICSLTVHKHFRKINQLWFNYSYLSISIRDYRYCWKDNKCNEKKTVQWSPWLLCKYIPYSNATSSESFHVCYSAIKCKITVQIMYKSNWIKISLRLNFFWRQLTSSLYDIYVSQLKLQFII